MQPLQNCIGPTIRIGLEILCLPYAGFLIEAFPKMEAWNSRALQDPEEGPCSRPYP